MLSKINQLMKKFEEEISNDPNKKRKISSFLSNIVSSISTRAMNFDESYCMRFSLPVNFSNKFFEHIDSFTQQDLYDAFLNDWGHGAMRNKMHSDPYYQICLLLICYAITNNEKNIKNNALSIMLFKLWNGRKTRFLKWCDPDIMKYVVSYMASNRYLVTKYNDPLDLVINYFVPTLLKAYEDKIKRDPRYLKNLFEGGYVRIRQLFVQDNFTNIKTGQRESRGGLMLLYKKAHDEGLSMKNPNIRKDEENVPGFGDYLTGSQAEEVANKVSDYITFNTNPNYSDQFVRNLKLNEKIPIHKKVVKTILTQMHNHNYYDQLHEIITIMLNQLKVTSQEEICGKEFYDKFKKSLSSKNNQNTRNRNELAMKILTDILGDELNIDLKNFDTVNQVQMRKVLFYGIAHNLREVICKR